MNWRTEWNAISANIQGVTRAAEFYVRTTAVRSDDMYAVLAHSLLPQTRSIYLRLQLFETAHASSLPDGAKGCLEHFLTVRPEVFGESGFNRDGAIQFRVTALTAFRAEFDYHIADHAAFARRQSERSFTHLQRSLVVDSDERQKWIAAFEDGEVACERLGAIRLLNHGIWAFKVSGIGERTDLVFQEPLSVGIEIERAADALVLTEWKVCGAQSDVATKVLEAKGQAIRYRSGVLAGIELTTYRYLVLVSRDVLAMPTDTVTDGITYRHVNIAVEPSPPSAVARRRRT